MASSRTSEMTGTLPLAGIRVVDLTQVQLGPCATQVLGDFGADLVKKEGREIVLELARQADVLVHNFRPGVVDRLGLDYASLQAINPRLVYASGSGFGPDGPLVHKAGQDLLAQSM